MVLDDPNVIIRIINTLICSANTFTVYTALFLFFLLITYSG